MPANLPPDYYAAEKRYRTTSDIQEKIEIIREMLAIMPKHKGTEHLQGDLKRKIAKLQSQSKKKHVLSKGTGLDHISREGAGQVALVGPPNSGKSSLIGSLTHAQSDVQPYPFSTYRPVVGMMDFQDIQIQLVDLPPLAEDFNDHWYFNIIRLTDQVLYLADLSEKDPIESFVRCEKILEEHKIVLADDGEKKPQQSVAQKTAIISGNKIDTVLNNDRLKAFERFCKDRFWFIPISIKENRNIEKLKSIIFKKLKIIRIYTKIPGKKPDLKNPYVLPTGSTVTEAAVTIHKDFAEKMTFARIWGSEKYIGQRVEKDHILEDKDILEIHLR